MQLRLSLFKAAFSRDPMSSALILAYILAVRDVEPAPVVVPSNSGYDACHGCDICDGCGNILGQDV